MTQRLFTFCFTLFLASTAWAAPDYEVVILPLEMPGYYNPLDSEALTKELEARLSEVGPKAHLQLGRGADLTAYKYVAGSEQPPSNAVAASICRAYQANYACWISIRFQPDYQADSGALALAGAARFWVYNAQAAKVVIDQPISLVRVGQVADINDEKASRAVALQLAKGCVKDLAGQVASIARQREVAPPVNTASWQTNPDTKIAQSRNYRSMVSATTGYQRAMKSQNLIDTTSTLASMNSAWVALNREERALFQKEYPGAVEMMTATPNYYYGGGYWPYRY